MKQIILALTLLILKSCYCMGQELIFDHLMAEKGLSQNSIFAVTQDSRGFMWYGSRFGLNRYDGNHFRLYKSSAADTTSISDDYITALYCDVKGILWAGTANGLNRFNPKSGSFKRIYLKKPGSTQMINGIKAIYRDRQQQLWIGTTNGLFLLTNATENTFTWAGKLGMPAHFAGNEVLSIFHDSRGYLWIGTNKALLRCRFNGSIRETEIFKHSADPASISYNGVTDIAEDEQNNLWFATENGGLNLFNRSGKTFSRFLNEPKNSNSLVHNAIRKMVKKSNGELWIGTQEGLSILNPITKIFKTVQHRKAQTKSLNQNSIYSIYEDLNGSMWIGTYYGGVNVSYASATNFKTRKYNDKLGGISHNVVSSIIAADGDNLWIGTEGGGLNYMEWDTGQFRHYFFNPNDPQSLGSDLVKMLYKDKTGIIWIGTHGGGLNALDPASGKFQRFFTGQDSLNTTRSEIVAILEAGDGTFWVGSQTGLNIFNKKGIILSPNNTFKPLLKLQDKNIKVLFRDSRSNIWIAETTGLYCYSETSRTLQRFNLPKGSNSASTNANYINCIIEDSKGNLWVGLYYEGLAMYDTRSNSFTRFYTTKNGLPNNNVLGIVEDTRHQLWISTSNGLSKFNPAEHSFQTFTTSDGLAGDEFNYNSFFRNRHGEIFFGCYNGLTHFFPDEIQKNNYKAPLVFTRLKLFNVPVKINAGDDLLHEDISFTRKLVFRHDQNIFSIEFALLNYIKSNKNRYAYKLQGVNEQWIETNIPSATYTNLPAGNYTLLVKGANNDGVWSKPASMEIHILPPFWKTWWAFCIYAIIVAALIFFVTRFFYLRELLIKDEELHQNKLNFFTNVSHEIRTHLTLIMAPIEKLMDASLHTPQVKKQLVSVKNNADRLLRLVSELMDFRKAETNHLKLNIGQHNLIDFMQDIYAAFEALSNKRKISFSFVHEAAPINLYFDREQLEKVFFNLISNAFKFTSAGGSITVTIQALPDKVTINIADTGRGIAEEHLDKLFTNFFQIDDHNIQNTGYGIGLALSKNILELHKGQIEVYSIPARGGQSGYTSFMVSLLWGNRHFKNVTFLQEGHTEATTEIIPRDTQQEAPDGYLPSETNQHAKLPAVLIVEDNAELQQLIRESLELHYRILVAKNGKQGWTMATEEIPDIIISDVMMPGMDGFTLCSHLKADERTSHVPIILLTAKSTETDRISGLSGGADVYLTKPFSPKVLQLHVRNLLQGREIMRQKFQRQLILEPREVEIQALDEQFLNKVILAIETHMEEADFGVDMLAEKIGMSQSVLYKKLKALTNMSVNDFSKSIRLKRAAQLLKQKQYTVYEIGYMVGFTDRKYFSREFKKQFGQTPSDYRN